VTIHYIFPNLELRARLALYAAFGLVGIAMLGPRFLPVGSGVLGVAFLVAGGLFVSAKHYRNKPLDLGFEDWQPASMAEFNRILSNLEKTRKAKLPVLYRRGCGVAVICGLLFFALMLAGVGWSTISRFVVAGAALSYPLLLTGHVRLWTPAELKMKMDAFRPVVSAAEPTVSPREPVVSAAEKPELGPTLVVTPYLRLDKDKESRQIPEDVRLMVEPRRKAEDFMGVQFQVAINNGANGKVPYMYAVFLSKGKGTSFQRFSELRVDGYEVEPGSDDQYGFVVLRQKTSGGGYHTTKGDCLKLLDIVTKALAGAA
jgi:hypothetical protein